MIYLIVDFYPLTLIPPFSFPLSPIASSRPIPFCADAVMHGEGLDEASRSRMNDASVSSVIADARIHIQRFAALAQNRHLAAGTGDPHYRTRMTYTGSGSNQPRYCAYAQPQRKDLAESVSLTTLVTPLWACRKGDEVAWSLWQAEHTMSIAGRNVTVLEDRSSQFLPQPDAGEIARGMIKHERPRLRRWLIFSCANVGGTGSESR